ncbi:MAG TPA: site-specific integrase [Chitinophagaceae bacterium]|nr:site-specific integrase [Chitinophagaceae bacterium]
MNTTLSILFYAKKAKATTDGLIPIYLRVTINGQRFEISTRTYVEAKQWSSEAGKVKSSINTEKAKAVNALLDTLRNRVYQIQRDIVQENLSFTIAMFKNKWLGIAEKPRMIIEIFRHHNNQLKELIKSGEFALGTLERYTTSLDHTQNFLLYKYNVSDLDIRKLDYSFITDYEYWLKTVRHCNHNTTMKYLANFKKIVLLCRKKGWLQTDPFFGFKMTKKEVIREVLTEEELQTIADKKFVSDRLTLVRDIFLFSCYTGLAYSEVKNLNESHINIGIDGGRWIFIRRQKTKKLSRIPLLEIPEEILSRYKNNPVAGQRETLLPILSNQKMNSYLKEIADVSGINKNLTFHIARHTFATTITLNNGASIEAVSDMLGHSSLKQTQHYSKVKEKLISEEMSKLRRKLFPTIGKTKTG